MNIILCLITFIAAEWAFLRIAKARKIGAPVTERSSHTQFTPTCGGIIVPIALIAFGAWHYEVLDTTWWLCIAGALVLAAVSFYDDIKPLSPGIRLFIQVAVVAGVYQQLCYPQAFHIYLLIIILGVGTINTINFIDGITGMLGFYTIVLFGTFAYTLYTYIPAGNELYIQLCILVILSMVSFLVFNIPNRIFAGDVGAITIGFLAVCMCVHITIQTHNASSIIFFIVSLFDAGFTTLQRLFAGKNILLPHREFIYEILTSRWHLPHVVVSLSYALLQLLINALYFLIPAQQHWTYLIATCILLTFAYFAIRQSPKSRLDE